MDCQAVSRLGSSKYCCQYRLILLPVCPHLRELFDTCSPDRVSENDLSADRACRWGLSRPDLCFTGAQEEWAFKRKPCPLAVPPSTATAQALWTGDVVWGQLGHLTFALLTPAALWLFWP